MKRTRKKLLSSTGIAVALIVGAVAIGTGAEGTDRLLPAFVLPAAACEPCAPCAACSPCDPCAPCAACGPCDPCAAAPAAATGCYVPRLREASANPCAIENPCAAEAACDPCAAANPCAVDDPCAAAMACEPCSPLNLAGAEQVTAVQEELNKRGFDAGAVDGIVGPQTAQAIEAAEAEFGLASTGEITPELMTALFAGAVVVACAACAPCAACGPCKLCEPCAACAPCEAAMPCAACGPCGPCEPCGPCGPCEAAAVTDVSEEELQTVYECLLEHMRTAYGDDWMDDPSDFASRFQIMQVAYSDSELDEARDFVDWLNVATAPYPSATHGGRFVTNHVNDTGEEAYRRYEEIGEMPVGGIVAKPSFTIGEDGEAQLGPLFLMEKMEAGFHEPSEDWKYTMVMPDGSIGGITQGQNSENVEFCIACHVAAPEGQDTLFFLPEHLRR